jgi:hypothetical protein
MTGDELLPLSLLYLLCHGLQEEGIAALTLVDVR